MTPIMSTTTVLDTDEVAAGLMDAQEYRRKWHGESGQASRGGGSSQ